MTRARGSCARDFEHGSDVVAAGLKREVDSLESGYTVLRSAT